MKVYGYKIEPGANLTGAFLEYANLEGANLSGAKLTFTIMPDGTIHD